MSVRGELILAAAFLLVANARPEAQGPDAGGGSKELSDEFLVKIGTAAVPFLIQRLDDARHSSDHDAVAKRLASFGIGDDSRIAGALDRFARRIILKKSTGLATETGLETDARVCEALKAIGRRGGVSGVELLRPWLGNNGLPERSRLVPYVSDAYLQCAIIGLGSNMHPYAQLDLRHMLERPPRSSDGWAIEKAIRRALR